MAWKRFLGKFSSFTGKFSETEPVSLSSLYATQHPQGVIDKINNMMPSYSLSEGALSLRSKGFPCELTSVPPPASNLGEITILNYGI